MIRVQGFTKWYGTFQAVKHLDLHVPAGQVHGFIGPNGAGKTTTIRFLATLVEPSGGKASINGFDVVRQVRDVRQSIGYMPDSFGVYEGMRVWEFLDFFGRAYGIAGPERRAVVKSVLELVDLDHKSHDLVEALSRGMQQRLCLAKTLVHDPPVLILDEPTSGLDVLGAGAMIDFIEEMKHRGKSVILSTHILTEAERLCDEIGILNAGRLHAVGTLEELQNRTGESYLDAVFKALVQEASIEETAANSVA